MYKLTNIDDVSRILDNDAQLTHLVRQIAVENDDEELSITCIGEAKDYLTNYCPDLKLKTISFVTTELCPHCDTEQIIHEIVQPCPNCKESLVACSMCKVCVDDNCALNCDGCTNGSKFSGCDFDEETGCIIDNEGE